MRRQQLWRLVFPLLVGVSVTVILATTAWRGRGPTRSQPTSQEELPDDGTRPPQLHFPPPPSPPVPDASAEEQPGGPHEVEDGGLGDVEGLGEVEVEVEVEVEESPPLPLPFDAQDAHRAQRPGDEGHGASREDAMDEKGHSFGEGGHGQRTEGEVQEAENRVPDPRHSGNAPYETAEVAVAVAGDEESAAVEPSLDEGAEGAAAEGREGTGAAESELQPSAPQSDEDAGGPETGWTENSNSNSAQGGAEEATANVDGPVIAKGGDRIDGGGGPEGERDEGEPPNVFTTFPSTYAEPMDGSVHVRPLARTLGPAGRAHALSVVMANKPRLSEGRNEELSRTFSSIPGRSAVLEARKRDRERRLAELKGFSKKLALSRRGPAAKEKISRNPRHRTNYTKPSFFVLGPQKTGTSSLWQYMRLHPHLHSVQLKEHLFFKRDCIRQPCVPQSEENCPADRMAIERKYLTKFPSEAWVSESDHDDATNATNSPRVRKVAGDWSATYFTCRCCPGAIKKWFPQAKLFILLRKPAERAFSRIKEQQQIGQKSSYENIQKFTEFMLDPHFDESVKYRLSSCISKAKGLFGKELDCAVKDQIFGFSMYDIWIRHWRKHFPDNQIKYIFSEDLQTKPAQVMAAVENYLGLPHHDYPSASLAERYNTGSCLGWDKTSRDCGDAAAAASTKRKPPPQAWARFFEARARKMRTYLAASNVSIPELDTFFAEDDQPTSPVAELVNNGTDDDQHTSPAAELLMNNGRISANEGE